LNRVEELADRPSGYKPKNAVGFKKLVELDKIIAESLNIKSRSSIAVQKAYSLMITKFGSELSILMDLDLDSINDHEIDARIIEGIRRMRAGKLIIKPGFDGQYGEVHIFSEADRPGRQKALL
jgi:PHP family Zn ribbon phosphoesterase